jgi:hypothetical protein
MRSLTICRRISRQGRRGFADGFDQSFELSEPEAYRRDVPQAQVHVLDVGHFALDTAADEIAALVRGFVVATER